MIWIPNTDTGHTVIAVNANTDNTETINNGPFYQFLLSLAL